MNWNIGQKKLLKFNRDKNAKNMEVRFKNGI